MSLGVIVGEIMAVHSFDDRNARCRLGKRRHAVSLRLSRIGMGAV